MQGLKRKFKRFNSYVTRYLPEASSMGRVQLFLDYALALLLHGATIKDYFAYAFYLKSNRARAAFITEKRLKRMVRHFNGEARIPYIRDKVAFNKHFSAYIHHGWLDPAAAPLERLRAFVEKYPEFIVKPRDGHGGEGIELLTQKELLADLEGWQERFKKEPVILEERIRQGGSLGALNPSSVNTLRVVALTTPQGVEIPAAVLRMGAGSSFTDNVSNEGTGALAAQVDVSTGIVHLPGRDIHGRQHVLHPNTGKRIPGTEIPEWTAVLELVRRIASSIPEVRYTGWDIAICENGRIDVIEGNTYVGGYSQQLSDQVGKWKWYKARMK